MSAALVTLVAHCRALCARRVHETDADLLRRFVRGRDTDAFEQLVERYAPLVWGVCRRVLPCEADCEDAFQATFLALVRQARSLDAERPLGAWLHTVAVRVARKAQQRSRRQRPQAMPPERPTAGDVVGDVGSGELLRLVDEEFDRLPAAVRAPLVLCCLEGRTRDEAAEALGCTVAAVKSRLERGRDLLRRRLHQRGIQLPAAFLVLTLTGRRVSAALCRKAMQPALSQASPAVAALVAAETLWSRLTVTSLTLLAAGFLGFGAFHAAAGDPPKDAPVPPARAVDDPPRDRFGDPLPEGAIRRFGTLRFRHDQIADLAFTPDGQRLLAGVGRMPLAVFDPVTGRKLREVGRVSANNNYGFAVSPDSRRVACLGFDVSLWDLQTGELVREFGRGRCQAAAFSPDGTRLAVVREMEAETSIVDAASGQLLASWTIATGQSAYFVTALAFSPDGKTLAALVGEYRLERQSEFIAGATRLHLWDVEKGVAAGTLGPDDAGLFTFAFQPGTGRLVTLGKEGGLHFWDMVTRKEVRQLPAPKDGAWQALRFSGDGGRCALYHRNGSLTILDVKEGKPLRRIDTGQAATTSPVALALSPDGKAVALGKLYGEACVRVWDVETGAERLADAGHRTPPTLALATDGRSLVSRGDDGRVFRWDLGTGDGRLEPGNPTTAVAPKPNLSGFRGPRWQFTFNHATWEIEVRSLDGSQLIRKTKGPSPMRGHALSPTGTHLAVSFQDGNHTVLLWDPEHEAEPRALTGHPDACQQLLFSHDGKRLVAGAGTHSGYASETIWVWDVPTAQVVRKLPTRSAPGQMLLTADDRMLITGGLWNDAATHAWDMETGDELALLVDPSLKETREDQTRVVSHLAITGLAFSADERFLAVVSSRGETSALSVWEIASWRLVKAFAPTSPRNHPRSLVFALDGRSLFVANADSTILEWDVAGRRGKATAAPGKQRLDALWQALARDPVEAYPAAWELLDHPAEAVRILKEKVAPVQSVDAKRLRELIAQLDAEDFTQREEASRQLLALGERAGPALRQALKDGLAAEGVKRAERLLEALSRRLTPEELRQLRAVAVLEWSARPEAEAQLRRLAGGEASARLTRAARAALQRREGKTIADAPVP